MNNNFFSYKKILVTGGTGSIGSAIVEELLKYNPDVIRIFSNDENSMFNMKMKYGDFQNTRFLVGDVRDKKRLNIAMKDIDIVFHAAALKHVPLCEYNPFEAIKTNVIGTQNIIETSNMNGVDRVINISTDKAVNPTNTMGITKLLTEKLIIDANYNYGLDSTKFTNVRFGNVLLSRGSVIPIIKKQIDNNEPITITDFDMTRYMMSIKDAVKLVLDVSKMTNGGETYVLKMKSVKLRDLVDVLLDGEEREIKIIGKRKGEKMHEELITEQEKEYAYENNGLLVLTDNPPKDFKKIKDFPTSSECDTILTKSEIRDYLERLEND